MKETKKYFNNIDFLRFLMILEIIMFHLFFGNSLFMQASTPPLYELNKVYVYLHKCVGTYGCMANDFFFIVSGFFLKYNFNKTLSFIGFIKQRVIRLLPVLLGVYIIYFLMSKIGLITFKKYDNLFVLLFLNNSGLMLQGTNIGGSWFVSALVFASGFYFYLYKHFQKYICDFITCLATIFSYAFLIHVNEGKIDINPLATYYNFINAGILQALAGLGLGIIIFNLYSDYKDKFSENFKDKKKAKLQTLLFSAFEVYILIFLINNMTFHKISFNNEIIFILGFCVLIFLFLIKRGIISKILDCKLSKELGKYTYSIFLVHGIVISFLCNFFYKTHTQFAYNHPILQIVIIIILSFAAGVMMFHLVERPMVSFLKRIK